MSSKKILNNLSNLTAMLIITVLIMAPLQITFADTVDVSAGGTTTSEPSREEVPAEDTETDAEPVPDIPESVGVDEATSVTVSEPAQDTEQVDTDAAMPEETNSGSASEANDTFDLDAAISSDIPTNDTGSDDLNVVVPGNGNTETAMESTVNEEQGSKDQQGSIDTHSTTSSEQSTTTSNEQDSEPEEDIETLASSSTPESFVTTTEPLENFHSNMTSSSPTSSSTESQVGTTTNDGLSSTGTPSIVTGDSIALANILNLVNTNFVNSEGVIVFDNFFETLLGDFDLRSIYNSLADFGCSLISCSQNDVTTNISNEAMIKNALVIEALTGRNTIEGGSTSTIDTGNAYAGLNLINVANTNVIDSNYLLVTMNAFKNVEGDIVFPSLSNFFGSMTGGISPDALTISNSANVVNNVAVSADSGSNGVEGNFNSGISTGASTASTNVFNQLNTSLAGGQSISMIFRVHGTWAGEIFGAPSNLAWTEDGQGGLYLFDTASALGTGGGNLNVNATNSVSIQNDVSVMALTGENAITGADTALITTGNALAGANIVNVANATVVGRNWILAIINILGDFTGNISFGRPDLWVGAQVEVPSKIKNDSLLTYKLTVINNGDAGASNVRLTDDYDESYIDIIDASVPYSTDGAGRVFWDIGQLDPGMATEISYNARIKNASYSTDITNMLSVIERESDNNRLDNSDTITVTTDGRSGGNGVRISLDRSRSSQEDVLRALEIDRHTASSTLAGKHRESLQELVLTNTSDKTIRAVVLHDVIADPAGTLIKDETWELGDVLPHEEVTISYKVTFSSDAREGLYLLSTRVDGVGSKPLIAHENGHITIVGMEPAPYSNASIEDPVIPEVLGISVTRKEVDDEIDTQTSSILSFAIPTAQAATRVDHGLPMTNVPYRYSLFFFILAIALSNIYYMVRKNTKDTVSDE